VWHRRKPQGRGAGGVFSPSPLPVATPQSPWAPTCSSRHHPRLLPALLGPAAPASPLGPQRTGAGSGPRRAGRQWMSWACPLAALRGREAVQGAHFFSPPLQTRRFQKMREAHKAASPTTWTGHLGKAMQAAVARMSCTKHMRVWFVWGVQRGIDADGSVRGGAYLVGRRRRKREGEKKKVRREKDKDGDGGKKSQRGNNSCSRCANLPVPCVARSVTGACVVGVKYSAPCLLKASPL
jgi:hypothetical protein